MIIGCAPYLSTEYRLPSQWSTLQNPKKNIKIKFNTTQNTHVSTFPVRLPCKSEQLLLRNPKRPFRSPPSTNSWSESKPTTLHPQCALSNPNHNSHITKCTKVQTPRAKIHRNPQLKIPKRKNVPSLEIQTCAGRARFGDPRSHRSHRERTGKTPNPP